VNIRAKFTFCTLTFHRCDNFIADNEATDIGATGFADVLLNQDTGLQTKEGLDDAFGGLFSLREYYTYTLGAFK